VARELPSEMRLAKISGCKGEGCVIVQINSVVFGF